MTEAFSLGGASKSQPQFAEMFQKVALVFKSKTFELFSDESTVERESEASVSGPRAVPLEPEPPPSKIVGSNSHRRVSPLDSQLALGLISSVFATVSSFEASYLQLQQHHAPFDQDGIRAADDSLVSHLKKLSEYKHFYRELRLNPGSGVEFLIGSCLEAQVDDNQSKLRLLGFVSDRLQAEIDCKDTEADSLRNQLSELTQSNLELSQRLTIFTCTSSEETSISNDIVDFRPCCGVIVSLRVFTTVLNDSCRAIHKFTKLFIRLMKKTGWDLDMAAGSLYGGISYPTKEYSSYALLSYVCLGMFSGFDDKDYGLHDPKGSPVDSNGHCKAREGNINRRGLLKQLVEHFSSSPSVELLSRDPSSTFSKFCEKKYEDLVHPSVESSIFRVVNSESTDPNSRRSMSVFYNSFINMANVVWALHKLAFCFDPIVEIFQVERGAEFSLVYMEDVTKKRRMPLETKPKVGFTVVPGFNVGRTVIQSQVYLTGN